MEKIALFWTFNVALAKERQNSQGCEKSFFLPGSFLHFLLKNVLFSLDVFPNWKMAIGIN